MSKLLELVRDGVRPLSPYKAFAKSFPAKLDANESPFALPEVARERVARALSEVHLNRYPDAGAHALREALADHLTVEDPERLVLGVGSDEDLAMLMRALSKPRAGQARARVLFPDPSFVMYGMRSIIEDCEPVPVPLAEDFQLDVQRMRAAIEESRPNLIFLASPNNPTGNCFRESDVIGIIEAAPDALVILDEAYVAFAPKSLRSLADRYENVAMLGTLSKIGLAAARVGWALLPRALADEVEKVRQPYNLNSLSQVVATLALTELWPVLSSQIAEIRTQREALQRALASVDALTVLPSDANFFLVRVASGAEALARELLARGVSVRAFKDPAGPLVGHLRITVGTATENQLLVDALRAIYR
jgi:histidinol-phosphate aminotransferase